MNLRPKKVKLADLALDDRNARQHTKRNLAAIVASLRDFGQRKPIIVMRDGLVIAGNGTVMAATELGWTELVALPLPADWSIDDARAYAIADNRTAELAAWDVPVLAAQLDTLEAAGFDPVDLGFAFAKTPEPKQKPTEEIDPDAIPQPEHTCPECGFEFDAE